MHNRLPEKNEAHIDTMLQNGKASSTILSHQINGKNPFFVMFFCHLYNITTVV